MLPVTMFSDRSWGRYPDCHLSTLVQAPNGLDLASGKKVWEYEAASPVTSSPAVAKGKVVVATADGQVICFG
jgi:PQQ-like domain